MEIKEESAKLTPCPVPFTRQWEFEKMLRELGYRAGALSVMSDGTDYCNWTVSELWKGFKNAQN